MSEESTVATVEHNGFTVTSSDSTEASLRTALEAGDRPAEGAEEPDASKAASVLGKKGGEAAAEKRRVEAREAKKQEKEAEAESTEDADPETKPGVVEKPRKPGDDRQARMLEATRKEAVAKREAREARQEAEVARREAAQAREELEASRRRAEPERPPERQRSEGKPNKDDFDTYEDYLDARDEHTRKTWEREQRQRQEQDSKEQHLDGYVRKFSTMVSEAFKADPSIRERMAQEVMELRPTFRLDGSRPPDAGNWIADELVDNAEAAPSLMLYLSENPDEFQRIASLPSPRSVTREMAKLVKSFEAANTGTPSLKPAVSKASPPVRPVTGSPQVADEGGYREGMSLDDYARKWRPAKSQR